MGKVSELRGLVRGGYKDLTLKTVYPDRYRAAVKKAPVVRGKVVFLEVREASLSDNFRVIASALEKRGSWQTQTVCIREGMENQLSTARRCLEAIPKLADAEFIFVSESSYFLSCLPIRPETTVIQVWHACGAFKKFGWSAVGLGFGTTAQDLCATRCTAILIMSRSPRRRWSGRTRRRFTWRSASTGSCRSA